MMRILIYDGSFEGLMCAIAAGFRIREAIEIRKADDPGPLLLAAVETIETDSVQAGKVIGALVQKLGMETFKRVSYAYFSESPGIGTELLYFLRYAFKTGPSAVDHLAHPAVKPIFEASRRVSREVHLMVGLVRFSETKSGIFYCEYEPTYDITTLLAPHFAERLSDQTWVIHDLRRHLAAFYDQKTWWLADLEPVIQTYSSAEDFYRSIWQTYFQHIAIESRLSPARQRQHMPKKYWKYLVEIQS
jgi:probable DNA metabolism protein